jgi:hypothetical protein
MWKNVLKLFFVSIFLLLAACVPRRIEVPSYEGRDFREVMSGMQGINEIETRMSILFEKTDTAMTGDGALDISRNGDMNLRVYQFGFLAMELRSREGTVKSTPRLDKNKTMILTKGLRDCLYWWDIQDFALSEDGADYLLENRERQVWVDRKTFLPKKQIIRFDEDRELVIFYERPARENDVWYQSKMTIELSRYRVTLTVKNISFKS